jgi:hypothetical protein
VLAFVQAHDGEATLPVQDAQLARAAWQMAAEVLAARPDQLDAFIQDQGECWHKLC